MPFVIDVSTINMPKGKTVEVRLDIARRISNLLERPGMTQTFLADRCGVDQSIVSKWKSGTRTVSAEAMLKISTLVDDEERTWWLEHAGFHNENEQPANTAKVVPLFKGKIAAGHGRELEGEIESELPFPKQWFPPGSKIIALKVDGESMEPLILSGYYVLIDISERELKRLVGHMVAARAPHGCTVKWLRKDKDTGFYQLIPQHVSEDYPVRIITPENEHEFGIIGRVVRWIGEPKPPKRRKE